MHTAKAPYITQELERRIRTSLYADTVPSTRMLARDFKTSKQTITKALGVLKSAGVLTIRPGALPVINKNALKYGSIVLVNCAPEEDWLTHAPGLLEQIRKEGFTTVFLQKPEGKIAAGSLPEDTVGCLFVNSTLTVEDAECLESLKIPFAACNALPGYSGINTVDFDFQDFCMGFLQRAVAAGRPRVGVLFFGRLEGFNTMMHSEFLRIKRRLGLPKIACDDLNINWSLSIEEMIRQTLDYLKKKWDFPDILFCFGGIDPELEPLFRDVPENMLVVLRQPLKRNFSDPRFLCYTIDLSINDLWSSGYELLREAIFTPGAVTQRKLRPVYQMNLPPVRSQRFAGGVSCPLKHKH